MKNFMKTSALVLTGALLITACGNKEQKSETNVNENPAQEKIEVKAVEGRKKVLQDFVWVQPESRKIFVPLQPQ